MHQLALTTQHLTIQYLPIGKQTTQYFVFQIPLSVNNLEFISLIRRRYCWGWRDILRFGALYVIMSTMASQITSVSIVCLTVCSGGDQRKHQSSASLPFVRRIHRWPVNSPDKGPATRKMFPFDDVIINFRVLATTHSASPCPGRSRMR